MLLHLIKGPKVTGGLSVCMREGMCVCVAILTLSLTELVMSKEPWSFTSYLIIGHG